jgi:hypothetical protein
MNTGLCRRLPFGLLASMSLLSSVPIAVSAASVNDGFDGLRLQFDNDLFAGQEQDEDYTGGLALTLSGERAREGLLSLDGILGLIDGHVTPPAVGTRTYFARQFGFMAFSPADITASAALQNDRPYASMVFASNGRLRVSPDRQTAWFSSMTFGVLGLSLSESIHNGVHSLVGSPKARGYSHQISAGGEPTARYTVAHQRLWFANPAGTLDVKTTVQGSIGSLTEASAAVSMRYGMFGTSWWSAAPELTDYLAAPVPTGRDWARPDIYLFAGVRVKARAYNAFLQGQFRDSDVRFSSSEVEPVIVHAWVGFVTELLENMQLNYSLNYQSAEVRSGDAARDALWGSVQISHSF